MDSILRLGGEEADCSLWVCRTGFFTELHGRMTQFHCWLCNPPRYCLQVILCRLVRCSGEDPSDLLPRREGEQGSRTLMFTYSLCFGHYAVLCPGSPGPATLCRSLSGEWARGLVQGRAGRIPASSSRGRIWASNCFLNRLSTDPSCLSPLPASRPSELRRLWLLSFRGACGEGWGASWAPPQPEGLRFLSRLRCPLQPPVLWLLTLSQCPSVVVSTFT